MQDYSRVAVIIVAGGRGHRAGGGLPKQYRMLAGQPVLRRTARAFLRHPAIARVLCVIHPDDAALYEAAVEGLDLLPPVVGGATRQESVLAGLESLAAGARPSAVLIHDAARPLVPARVIDDVVAALRDADGALPGLPVVDTLRRVLPDGRIEEISRDNALRAQTPQGFRFKKILHAHRAACGVEATDDAMLAHAAGLAVRHVDGAEELRKLTVPEDFQQVELMYFGHMRPRIGSGFDVHRLRPGNGVILGGHRIECEYALEGHSDADVVLHALTDAIYGLLADGDIGSHFPPSDPQWRGRDSAHFLRHAASRVLGQGGRFENIDITIICERPKIGPYRMQIRQSIANILGIPLADVGVKATTTEGLGFTGRGEGIAAQVAVLVSLPVPSR